VLAEVFALCAVAGATGIHIEELSHVKDEEAGSIAAKVKALAERASGSKLLVDDLVWSECPRADHCLEDIRARMRCDSILLLKLQGGATRIRVLAELHAEPRDVLRIILDVPRDAPEMEAALAPLVAELFPSRAPAPPRAVEAPAGIPPPRRIATAPEARSSPRSPALWPYLAFGASAVAAVYGVVLGLGSRDARSRLEHEALTRGEIAELDGRAHARMLGADALLGAAIVGIAGGVILILLD
jgi:hypothetical protein